MVQSQKFLSHFIFLSIFSMGWLGSAEENGLNRSLVPLQMSPTLGDSSQLSGHPLTFSSPSPSVTSSGPKDFSNLLNLLKNSYLLSCPSFFEDNLVTCIPGKIGVWKWNSLNFLPPHGNIYSIIMHTLISCISLSSQDQSIHHFPGSHSCSFFSSQS